MALFKILKGQEKNLPTNKTEGWAYVTTDEGNMYVDVSTTKRVKIGAHADTSTLATNANGLKNQGTLNSQEKIDGFLVANSLQYATFKTTEQNNVGMASNDGMIISIPWTSTSYGAQIAIDDNKAGIIKFRGKGTDWGSWFTLLHSGNYNDYAVAKASSSTDNAIVRWDGTDGKKVQNSLLTIGDNGLLTLQIGNHLGAKLGSAYITSASPSSGEVILQNGHLRFGADSWDYNQWAGLKYSNKTIYLGLADGTIFTANSAQSGGTLALPGIRYFSINGKVAIDANDGWLRINEGKAFSSGVYFGLNVVRTDGELLVGGSGNKFYANSSGNGYFSNTLGIGGTNTSYKLYVNGASYINGNTTINGWLKVQNTTDSKNSQDSNASLAIQGGISIAKQLSAKTVRIDGSSSDASGSTTQGCAINFNKTTNCIEFVFD